MATEGEAEVRLEDGEMQIRLVGGVCSEATEGESVECYSSSILSLFIKCNTHKGKKGPTMGLICT